MHSARSAAAPRGKGRAAPPHNFVERLALVLESDGFPRIAGRIFGLLILSESELSLDGIAGILGASKASVSVNTRMLEQKGVIERVSRPADRRDYYIIAPDPFIRTMEQRIARWNRVRSVFAEAMSDSSIAPGARARMKDFDASSGEIAEVLTAALHRLKSPRKR
jgi:DNA-binding transcriptional regulator GbsR (MarR family)